MRILMADDDATLRHGLGIQLKRWGYDPVICANGEEARSVLAHEAPPLVAISIEACPASTG